MGLATVMTSVGKEESILFMVLLAGALTAFVGWIFDIFVVKRTIRQHLQEVLAMARGYLKRT
jgi:branched-subunit amino acid ABC-type transport system permease component